ncbi:HPr family phosphocarrier protein [Caproiciproducens faecalis]|uniref:HPr family phosphocarrier protein n=1 Tax=Caproiciproducens faecalis TaxID=2820301 RepID=A0ABS7DJT9_9FIRM|nr:HPr family phosphocarrier protein [Caproiciproducens faecalis]
MQTFQHIIKDEVGLHARPAGMLVKLASSCSSDISITFESKKVSAKKLFAVMGLCAKRNDEITITVEGENEEADCLQIKEFCEQNL